MSVFVKVLFLMSLNYGYCFVVFLALKRKLLMRRSVNELVDQGIYPRKLQGIQSYLKM